MARIQENVLAHSERQVLNWLCRKLAGRVTSDQMTALGLFGAALAITSDALSRLSAPALWFAILGYVLHWFGDSLDGSIARHQGLERPRYGYFVDHSVDALGNFLIMAGLGLTTHVRMDVALFALAGYFMLSMYTFLKQQATGDFQLTFLALGPTELRICLIVLTLGMIFGVDRSATIAAATFSIYDAVIGFAAVMFIGLFVWSLIVTANRLRRLGG